MVCKMNWVQAWKLWGEGNSLKLVDPAMVGPHSTTQIVRWIRVALLCIQKHEERPTMSDVCSMLNRRDPPEPNPPAIFALRWAKELFWSASVTTWEMEGGSRWDEMRIWFPQGKLFFIYVLLIYIRWQLNWSWFYDHLEHICTHVFWSSICPFSLQNILWYMSIYIFVSIYLS